jgi:hypothetical protein
MKHLKLFESFGDKPYWKIEVAEFNRDDKSELFQSTEVAKIIELLKGLGYDVELENIFYNPVETLNKVYKIKGKKTSPLAKGDNYYKDDIVLYKLEDEYFDVYFAKITEIPDQTRSERLNGHKAIPLTDMDYLRADQLDGLEQLFKDRL